MIDIQSPDFIPSFDISKANVAIFDDGHELATAVDAFFSGYCTVNRERDHFDIISSAVKDSELIFICCNAENVDRYLGLIREESLKQNRNLDSFVCVTFSSLYPGFTVEMQEKHFGMRIVYCPDFSNIFGDVGFRSARRRIFGGEDEDTLIPCKYFEAVQPKRVESGNLVLMSCHPTAAELTKICTSALSLSKIRVIDEIEKVCEGMKIPFSEVQLLTSLDQKLGDLKTPTTIHPQQLADSNSLMDLIKKNVK